MNSEMEKMPNVFISVGLSSEEYLSSKLGDILLGTICTPDLNITIDKVRQYISNLPATPEAYQFIRSDGCPILETQEHQLTLEHVVSEETVRIRKLYGKPRIGIKLKTGCNEKCLGFVLIAHSSTLEELRINIYDLLKDWNESDGRNKFAFYFEDRNNWPIAKAQEQYFRVVDLIQKACVVIHAEQRTYDVTDSGSTAKTGRTAGRNASSRKRHSVKTDKNKKVGPEKSVLISYVRSEARPLAHNLKEMLTRLGLPVYLDEHEINGGVDWQDALNEAVYNCIAFVPLVTQKYGETKWTNREIKYADYLQKPIIPVSFMNTWPPTCLGIQFSTKQYVYWKRDTTLVEGGSEDVDINHWPQEDVTHVGETIKSLINVQNTPIPSPLETDEVGGGASQACSLPASITRQNTLRSCPAKLRGMDRSLSQNREGTQLIVISAHAEQLNFVRKLQDKLKQAGMEVWCSVPEHHTENDILSPESQTATPLSQEVHWGLQRSVSKASSGLYSSQSSRNPEEAVFQEYANEAGVVLVLLSDAYGKSKRCKKEMFYCEHRKKIIPIQCEKFQMPCWMSMLIGTAELLTFEEDEGTNTRLVELVHKKLQPSSNISHSLAEESSSTKASAILKKKMPTAKYVYISGGTTFYNTASQEICTEVGKELARLVEIHVVTGGCAGVGRAVAKSYEEECLRLKKPAYLWHILPLNKRDEREVGEPRDCGSLIYSGESVRERECIVAQVFPICILIEGGPGAAHEAQQFMWNDHLVLPVKCTGGAAGGTFQVPKQIFDQPVGVASSDWSMLRNNKASDASDIGRSMASIVNTLHERFSKNGSDKSSSSSLLARSASVPFQPFEDTTARQSHIKDGIFPQSKAFSLGAEFDTSYSNTAFDTTTKSFLLKRQDSEDLFKYESSGSDNYVETPVHQSSSSDTLTASPSKEMAPQDINHEHLEKPLSRQETLIVTNSQVCETTAMSDETEVLQKPAALDQIGKMHTIQSFGSSNLDKNRNGIENECNEHRFDFTHLKDANKREDCEAVTQDNHRQHLDTTTERTYSSGYITQDMNCDTGGQMHSNQSQEKIVIKLSNRRSLTSPANRNKHNTKRTRQSPRDTDHPQHTTLRGDIQHQMAPKSPSNPEHKIKKFKE